MNIYDELKKLEYMENAFNDWKDYRENLTAHIVASSEKGTDAVIIGAGNCDDMDIKVLLSHFESVTLADRDEINPEKIAEKYSLNGDELNRLHVIKIDLVGIEDDDFRKLSNEMVMFLRAGNGTLPKISDFAEFVISRYERIIKSGEIKTDKDNIKYDYTIISGVHSQLFNIFARLWDVCAEVYGEEARREMSVYSFISKMTLQKIGGINDYLLGITKKGLITNNEVRRVGQKGAIEGANQFFIDMQRRLDELAVSAEDMEKMLWPFDVSQGKVYEMNYIKFV